MKIDVRSNIGQITAKLNGFVRKQIPFATAQAINAVTVKIQQAEQANLPKELDRPTPFTVNAIKVRRASKGYPVGTVYMMDRTAAYLEPYEFGGLNKLNSRALLKPVDAPMNQYGNLSRNQLAKYKARKDCFVGTVQTKAGPVSGVWQRTTPQKLLKGGKLKAVKGANHSGHLVLLIKFEDAHEAKQRIGYHALAAKVFASSWNRELGKALGAAIASANC